MPGAHSGAGFCIHERLVGVADNDNDDGEGQPVVHERSAGANVVETMN